MTGRLRSCALLSVLAAAAACSDSTGPGNGTLSRFTSLSESFLGTQDDSARVSLPSTTHWTLAHGGASWLTLLDTSGTGTMWMRWRHDPTPLPAGTYVDTLTLQRGDGGAPVRLVDSLQITAFISPYITMRRAWLPGERDSAVKAISALGAAGLDPSVLSPDSTVVVVPNPLYQPAPGGRSLIVLSPTTSGMTLIGVDLFEVDSTTGVPDTVIQWLQAFWYNTTTPTYKGYGVLYGSSPTTSPTALNNASWDASGGTSGGGGGEFNPTTGEYWELTSGKMQITANTLRTAAGSIITSGPDSGGVQRNGTMGGRIFNATLREIAPTAGLVQNFSVDFRSTPIPAARIECVNFGTPVLTVNAHCNP